MSNTNESLLWFVPEGLTVAEQRVAARAAKGRKLFVFLRDCQRALFDEAFQQELLGMYRQTGAGKPPVAPARMAMVTLLQAYTGVGDQVLLPSPWNRCPVHTRCLLCHGQVASLASARAPIALPDLQSERFPSLSIL